MAIQYSKWCKDYTHALFVLAVYFILYFYYPHQVESLIHASLWVDSLWRLKVLKGSIIRSTIYYFLSAVYISLHILHVAGRVRGKLGAITKVNFWQHRSQSFVMSDAGERAGRISTNRFVSALHFNPFFNRKYDPILWSVHAPRWF